MVAKRFALAVEIASWTSVVLRVAQFLLFSTAAVWRKATFAALAALLALVALTSGLRLS